MMSHRKVFLPAVTIAALIGGVSLSAAPANAAATSEATTATTATVSPYMGWSSWSLQATSYPGTNPQGGSSWLNEAHVLEQANALVTSGLKDAGYQYVNIDALWYADLKHKVNLDQYGRVTPNADRFPNGMKSVATKIHALGLKAGIYDYSGMPQDAYAPNYPIYGSTDGCTTQSAVLKDSSGQPVKMPNQWGNSYVLDYSAGNTCGYEYTKSIATQFVSWGFDYLKLDGVTPGSNPPAAIADVTKSSYAEVGGWKKAFDALQWKGQFHLSWALDPKYVDYWRANSVSVRNQGDVESYGPTLVDWSHVSNRWSSLSAWQGKTGNGFFVNLDSLDIGNGQMDGLNDYERRSAATFWAMAASPLFTGDDLTKLDTYGKTLLTNPEVIAQDQGGRMAKPVSTSTQQQVWYVKNADGSTSVALYNLGSSTASVTANWSDIGLGATQTVAVRDLWAKQDKGSKKGSYTTQLPAHASVLLKLQP